MSNVTLNVTAATLDSAFNLFGTKTVREQAAIELFASMLASAAFHTICNGSDTLNTFVERLEKAKGGRTAKLRKFCDSVSLAPYGAFSHKGFTRSKDVKGSTRKAGIVADKSEDESRVAFCEALEADCIARLPEFLARKEKTTTDKKAVKTTDRIKLAKRIRKLRSADSDFRNMLSLVCEGGSKAILDVTWNAMPNSKRASLAEVNVLYKHLVEAQAMIVELNKALDAARASEPMLTLVEPKAPATKRAKRAA